MANNNWYLIEPNYDSSDFVEDEVIPTIKDAIKRGVDIGVS